jgi:methyl-accepting chemotaxis protein
MRGSDSRFFICAKEKDVGKRKRSRKRDKRPVLTSPWKIGALVALMLAATSFGVGYYMVRVYKIDLYWLSSDMSRWVVDSYQFFREIYPAAAGVVLLALITYFVIASAVRRYKYYLDSGQDYRNMISLAESIDDLTNPAQIARLSEYPELQEVLRNYGAQIREISEGMEIREEEMRSVDLEVEIDSIIEGKGINETLADGKWWAPIARKVQAWVETNAGGTAELKKLSASSRNALGRASLSCGRVAETVANANEDILGMVTVAGQLSTIAGGFKTEGSGTVAAQGSSSDAITAIESAAFALEERGAAIHDLTEESNGLALNMALMAARGDADEKDLAQLAEKVRSSAEKFGKLGRELEKMARNIAENSRNARSVSGRPAGESVPADAGKGLKEISEKIESYGRALQNKMKALGNDVEEMNRALRPDSKESPEKETSLDGDERIRTTDGSIVNFGSGAEDQDEETNGIDDSELVIDHGKLWEGPEADTGESPGVDEAQAGLVEDMVDDENGDDSGDFLISGFQEAMSAMHSVPQQHVEEDDTLDRPSPQEEETLRETVDETAGDAFFNQHQEDPSGVVDELFAAGAPAQDSWDDMQMEAQAPAEAIHETAEAQFVEPEIVQEPEAHGPAHDAAETGTGEEPVYDLFELGAVEYVENTEANL